jgi:DNA-binding CsgD family transcriptional regulator
VVEPALGGLLEVVAAGVTRVEYERALFAALATLAGFDVGLYLRADGLGAHAPGFDPGVRRAVEARIAGFGDELADVKRAAMSRGGVAVDREVLGRARLERTRTYRELMRPHRGRASLHVYLGPAHASQALLVLGRTGPDFQARELARLSAARPLLSVCERAVLAVPCALPPRPRLSPREREILAYLRLGYSNPQIASASGTSFRTVRNQLSTLFDKLEVATRAEAVARSYELQLQL